MHWNVSFAILFDLLNAPGEFQQPMDVVPSSFKLQFAPVYLDNIVIISKTPEHLNGLILKIFMPLYTASEAPKLKKCHFFTNKID